MGHVRPQAFRHVLQLWHPFANQSARRVQLAPHLARVDQLLRRELAAERAGHLLPPVDVLLQVSVQLDVPEVQHAPLPRQAQHVHEEGGHQHPHGVVAPTDGRQLAHGGVHHGVARQAALPSLELLRVPVPLERAHVGQQRLPVSGREVEQQVPRKLAQAELAQERGAVRREARLLLPKKQHLVPRVAYGELPVVQMAREAGRGSFERDFFEVGRVKRQSLGHEFLKSAMRGSFSGLPLRAQAR
mmetsp:Transcript_39023/g.73220  ORF Transcript_39023/g.73220 Transcript_39023/m.73220 type:complete len:244 (-) Transcript_39023:833-1564(-)